MVSAATSDLDRGGAGVDAEPEGADIAAGPRLRAIPDRPRLRVRKAGQVGPRDGAGVDGGQAPAAGADDLAPLDRCGGLSTSSMVRPRRIVDTHQPGSEPAR